MSEFKHQSVVIIGAGIFGLSTALAIADRHPATQITIVDRATPPVEDGSSVDTTRCIRADYADPMYAKLAEEAQHEFENDPELSKHYFKQGMSFVTDGEPGPMLDVWSRGLVNIKANPSVLIQTETPKAVYQQIHGKGAEIVPLKDLTRPRKWNRGYCNLQDAFVDAKEIIRVYYERCLSRPSISFECGVPVQQILKEGGHARGVLLANGKDILADLTLVAAGAWSPKLIDLEGLVSSSAIEVAWLKLTDNEVKQWSKMSITTNLSTGFNIFPPYKGEIKCLRRSAGYKNTVSIPHPENPSKIIQTSLPRTIVTNPTDMIPAEAEAALRENLREIMPQLADRKFDRTKLCWLSQTQSADFIIAPHPSIQDLHVATGGSAHAWKFLPIIGGFVLDSMMGNLDPKLAAKWAYAPKGADGGSSPRMGGNAQELREFVRSSQFARSML
ncbi:hypothetical protein N7478_002651 [Penicillium angulare]|uniref:uncharacterized protein n=1 Tax=Penicillium angulare TaxID=116970 RepID=UPI0025417BD5|nr:uncharacterized protein N7478_002651 [Penicillium angulare]KAJ5286965.1 hypothetical protein N7478_002651 [Penicillium angulare]